MKNLENTKAKRILAVSAVLLSAAYLAFFGKNHETSYLNKMTKTDFVEPGNFERTVFYAIKNALVYKSLDNSKFHMDLFRLVNKVNRDKTIFVVQIGANRGEDFIEGKNLDDPVVEFVVNENTKGLLIEAVPSNYEILVENTKMYEDRYRRVNAAVIHPKTSDKMSFYTINTQRVLEKWPEAPYWIAKNRIGSFNENHVRKHLVSYTDKLLQTGDWPKYYIDKIDLDAKEPSEIYDILHAAFPESDGEPLGLLHVDAEGYDWKIAAPFLDLTLPKIVVFEKNHLPAEEISTALGVLKEKGYATWKSGNNVYAVHLGEDLLKQL